jgi:hypothetical protein
VRQRLARLDASLHQATNLECLSGKYGRSFKVNRFVLQRLTVLRVASVCVYTRDGGLGRVHEGVMCWWLLSFDLVEVCQVGGDVSIFTISLQAYF